MKWIHVSKKAPEKLSESINIDLRYYDVFVNTVGFLILVRRHVESLLDEQEGKINFRQYGVIYVI